MDGMVVIGQNIAVTNPNTGWSRDAMRNLEWLVVMDLFENESASGLDMPIPKDLRPMNAKPKSSTYRSAPAWKKRVPSRTPNAYCNGTSASKKHPERLMRIRGTSTN